MPKRRKKQKSPAPARFKIGDRVRVRHGTTDDGHPDMPLGGWAGTICEIPRRRMYGVRWSKETLARIHPVYKRRCAIAGDVLEEYFLFEDDLEPDAGGPLAMEQPTRITPRPLSEGNGGDRVRKVFGLTSDDFLPTVDLESLETYYDYLVEHLSLPAEARCYCEDRDSDAPPGRTVTAVALDREIAWDEDEGIYCRVRTVQGEEVVALSDMEFRRVHPNFQLVGDFTAWFLGEFEDETEDAFCDEETYGNELYDDEGMDEDEHDIVEKLTWRGVAILGLKITALAVSFGALMGAVITAIPWAGWGACIGGIAVGAFYGFSLAKSDDQNTIIIRPRFLSVILALALGGMLGVLFGVLVVAFVGAVLGIITGSLLWRLLPRVRLRLTGSSFEIALFAAACGAVCQAFYRDRIAALEGIWIGAAVGLAIAMCFCLVIPLVVFLGTKAANSSQPYEVRWDRIA